MAENIWKPNPEIADYYARVETGVTSGVCPLGCAMRAHVMRAPEPFHNLPSFLVWQHAMGCMAAVPAPSGKTKGWLR